MRDFLDANRERDFAHVIGHSPTEFGAGAMPLCQREFGNCEPMAR